MKRHGEQCQFEALVSRVASEPRPKLDYSQLSHSDFLCVYIYFLHLLYQGCYMLLWRALGRRMEEIPKQQMKDLAWGLTIPMLREAHKSCSHPAGLVLPIAVVLDCRLEILFVHKEMNRRGKAIPMALTMIGLDPDYGSVTNDPNIVQDLDKRLGLGKEENRFRFHDPRTNRVVVKIRPAEEEPMDSYQKGLLAVLEEWRKPARTTENIGPRPPFPAPDDMLPEEREFWEGPMARAWEAGQAVLDKQVPIYSGEKESIFQDARNRVFSSWDTIEKRQEIFNPPADEWDTINRPRERVIVQGPEDICDRETPDPLADIEAAHLYRIAQDRWGESGKRFVEAWLMGKNVTEASDYAGISRQIGHKYWKNLKKSLQ